MNGGEHGSLNSKVRLPPDFPQVLPEVFIDRSQLSRRIPHVEKDGKICIAPSTGVLLDTSNPRGLVRDAIERARKVILDGLSGANVDDFVEEFLSYWNVDLEEGLVSICHLSGLSRPVQLLSLVRPGKSKERMTLAADDFNAAKAWVTKVGWRIGERREAFFFIVEEAFIPPDFNEILSTRQMLDLVLDRTDPGSYRSMQLWIRTRRLPAIILFSLPLKHDQGHVLIGVRLEAAVGEARARAQKGFRPGHVPASLEMNFTKDMPVTRLQVGRLDPEYLLTRGGADNDLYSRTIIVVGCGSIGSHLVERLASLGVGRLRLIDPEELSAENIHRHALGVSYIDSNKAEGMKATLSMRYPHIDVVCRDKRVEELLQTEPDFITGGDMIIIALGDETLELRLNDILRDRLPRLHVWVEPLGIGGHVLATGVSVNGGCFRCLFGSDPTHGLYNQSAFAAPGQKFQKSFSGCAGTFTPFAGIDADRAAIEASLVAARVLRKDETENHLVSWRGYEDDFNRAGFQLSARGKLLRVGERRRDTQFLRTDCQICSRVAE
jgi:molybdopterin/thiamine biosynthesis adenylyltransferase